MVKKTFLYICLLFVFSSFSEEKQDSLEELEKKRNNLEESAEKNQDNLEESKDEVSIITPSEEEVTAEESKNQVSESFSSTENESVEGNSLLTSIFEDYSWFFEKKQTKNKVAIIPSFYSSKPFGTVLGIRFFTYSNGGYGRYIGTSFSNQLFTSFMKWNFEYINRNEKGFEIYSYLSYDGFSELFYGDGMNTKEADLKKIFSHKMHWNHEIKYTSKNKAFTSLAGELILRSERQNLQDGKTYFPSEILIYLRGKIGYDTRDSLVGAEKGHYHQVSFGCVPSLGHGSSFCIGEVDLRYYHNFSDKYFLALRSFAGSSFISYSSYSLNYTLGGGNVLRGFSENRFRGDKVYFVQSELRAPLPIWGDYLSGALFAELGEVAQYRESFENFKWNFGTGLRVGVPPDHRIKLRVDFGFALLDSEKSVNFIVGFLQAF